MDFDFTQVSKKRPKDNIVNNFEGKIGSVI